MIAAIGHLAEFQPQREKVSDYLECVSLYVKLNGVAEGKQVAVLLTAIGGEIYTLLTSLLSPEKPRDKRLHRNNCSFKSTFQAQTSHNHRAISFSQMAADTERNHSRVRGRNEIPCKYV